MPVLFKCLYKDQWPIMNPLLCEGPFFHTKSICLCRLRGHSTLVPVYLHCPSFSGVCSFYCCAFRLLWWHSDKHPHSLTPPCVLAPTRISLYSFLTELSTHKLLQICWQQGVQPIKASPLKCMLKTHLVALVAFPRVAFGIIQQGRHSIRHTDRS